MILSSYNSQRKKNGEVTAVVYIIVYIYRCQMNVLKCTKYVFSIFVIAVNLQGTLIYVFNSYLRRY